MTARRVLVVGAGPSGLSAAYHLTRLGHAVTIKLGDGSYEIDYDYCKGCGLCAAECPCGAVEMEP